MEPSRTRCQTRSTRFLQTRPATMDKVQPGSSASVVQAELKTTTTTTTTKIPALLARDPNSAPTCSKSLSTTCPRPLPTPRSAPLSPRLEACAHCDNACTADHGHVQIRWRQRAAPGRGAMFDFASRMDAITFWNSVRKSYVEQFLVHLTVPDVDMTFLAKPEIPSCWRRKDYLETTIQPTGKTQENSQTPDNRGLSSPETRSHSISRQPTAAANAATASGTGATPTGPGPTHTRSPSAAIDPPASSSGHSRRVSRNPTSSRWCPRTCNPRPPSTSTRPSN
ncbi:hypothetical protein BCR44DRAFT_1296451 [Catenaria anguillulae PL171]|uniref:Uncharacterized protein n=1 Tax=Catenaria anguillulae PL171 TaxID=765915 RepID=A0A1Y2HZR2_9FUNG|nr:hypothetical protein BCR44DRAFT_1296451 [Catenaria anguillulae PL171]